MLQTSPQNYTFVCLTDKIQHGQAFFVFGQTQAAAQLLQKHGQRFRGTQEQHRVHFRNVHAFIVNIHNKMKRSSPETSLCLAALRSSSGESPVNAMDEMPRALK